MTYGTRRQRLGVAWHAGLRVGSEFKQVPRALARRARWNDVAIPAGQLVAEYRLGEITI